MGLNLSFFIKPKRHISNKSFFFEGGQVSIHTGFNILIVIPTVAFAVKGELPVMTY